ncbi:MAG: hypothetical protein U0457_14095 [Candidatus Sericytochromatia bacterium]
MKKIILLILIINLFSIKEGKTETINLNDKIKKKQKNNYNNSIKNNTFAIELIFNKLPKINIKNLENNISKIEPLKSKFKVTNKVDSNDNVGFLYEIEFDNHKIKLVGLNAPVPKEVMDKTIDTSFWKPEQKEIARNHKSQVICYYEGNSKNIMEKYISLYKIALALNSDDFIGILDEKSWNYTNKIILKDLLEPKMLKSMRKDIPLVFFTNLIKIPTDDGVWFVSKGNNTFGIKEFAYFGKSLVETEKVTKLFESIFYYMYRNNIKINVGETMEMNQIYYRFAKVTEYTEYLESNLGTLVLIPEK